MIPSLTGRLQTRVAMMVTIGLIWSAIVAIFSSASFASLVTVLVLATVLGLGWEYLYHRYSQTRWDRDFPSGLFLVMGFVELIPVLAITSTLDMPVSVVAIHFLGIWLLVWLFLQGPIRVVVPRWRFRHGRLW